MAAFAKIEGTLLDYFSPSVGEWVPVRLIKVDAETGNVMLDAKPAKWFDKELQRMHIRPRTKPDLPRMEWIRTVLREGRLETEAGKIFQQHATATQDSAQGQRLVLTEDQCKVVSKSIDQVLMVSGSVCAIKNVFAQSHDKVLTKDCFLGAFWDLMWGVQKTYGNALNHAQFCTPRRLEDPQTTFVFTKELGKGTYGSVYLATEKEGGRKVAVKRIEKDPELDMSDLDPEIEHLKYLDHPNIVKLYEFFDFENYVYLVLDFCQHGDLSEAVKKSSKTGGLSVLFVQDVIKQILMSIAHVHARGIVHMDIKAANIMLMPQKRTCPPAKTASGYTIADPRGSSPHVMLIDLGVAKHFRPGDYRNNRPGGTPATMAPEVWWGVVTPKADVFSTGVVMFEMLTLNLPFACTCDAKEAKIYWTSKPEAPWHLMRNAPDSAIQLTKDMLQMRRDRRKNATECLKAPFAMTVGPQSANPLPSKRDEILQRLVDVPRRSVLYKSVGLAIARAWPANQNPTVKKMFTEFDVDRTGRLRKEHIAKAMEHLKVSKDLAIEAADCMDLSRDGTVDWTEFVAACLNLGDDCLEDDLQRVFNDADRDKDGLLDQEDVKRLLASDALRTDAAADAFSDIVGRTGNGARIDWATFRRHFRSISRADAVKKESPDPQRGTGYDACNGMGVTDPSYAMMARDLFERVRYHVDDVVAPRQETPPPRKRESPRPLAPTNFDYDQNLKKLADMGLTDRVKNIACLRKHNNQMSERVISELLNIPN